MKSGTKAVSGSWWRRRSLKLRIAIAFAIIAGVLMLGLVPFVYHLIESRFVKDLDHELGIDWILIEAHLEADETEGVRWKKDSPSTLDSGGYAESWFDVWSEAGPLMRHAPPHGADITTPPLADPGDGGFHNLFFEGDRSARVLQKPARISGKKVTLRVFRDRSNLEETLRQVLILLVLGVPVSLFLAAAGGYLMAGRTLRPIVEMTDQARRIHSDSLGRRLPNPNPHDELGQLATVFNETLERLERSFEALRRFTSDASHELRTPLTALRSVGEIGLREDRDADALRETIGSMLEEGQRLHDLADTLLMLARVDGGRAPLRREALKLDSIVAEVCESLEVLANEKGQHLVIATTPGPIVSAEPILLRQAVMNLLHNAIRHSPRETTVRITSFPDGTEAVVEVADDGPGIAPEHREKVFERFYRIDKARRRADGGTGLGLALVKMSVERFGGTISLESEVGRGSRFCIRLPMVGESCASEPVQ